MNQVQEQLKLSAKTKGLLTSSEAPPIKVLLLLGLLQADVTNQLVIILSYDMVNINRRTIPFLYIAWYIQMGNFDNFNIFSIICGGVVL